MSLMLQILTYLLNVLCYFIPICRFLPHKLTAKQKSGFFLLLLLNILFIGRVAGNAGVILLIITSCIYISWISKDRLMNICTFIATYMFCVLLDNIFTILWDTFICPIAHIQTSYPIYFVYILSYLLLLSLICPLIKKLFHSLIKRINSRLPRQLLFLVTVNLTTCLCIFLFNIIIGDSIGYNRKIIMFNCILFAVYFAVSTVLIVNLIKGYLAQMDMEMRQDSYNQLQQYTNHVEDLYSSLRSFKHDYSNIMLSMSGYIESDDMEGLKEYFNKEILPLNAKLTGKTAHLNQLMNLKISELKSVISSKLLYAIELNIAVSIEVTEEITQLPVNTLDLARIIGIFLDNAIEASLETTIPSINFAIIKPEKEVIFIISNSFLDKGIPYASLREPNVSTKGKNRGLGLYNAHEMIAKYNHVFSRTEIKDGFFTQYLHISISG